MGAQLRPAYQARVGGEGRSIEMLDLDEDSDREAVLTAFGAASPFGHSLWRGRKFLGYFPPGEGRFGRVASAPRPRTLRPMRPSC